MESLWSRDSIQNIVGCGWHRKRNPGRPSSTTSSNHKPILESANKHRARAYTEPKTWGIFQPSPSDSGIQDGSDKPHWIQHEYHDPGGQIRQLPIDQGISHGHPDKDSQTAPGGNKEPQEQTSRPTHQENRREPEERYKLVERSILMYPWGWPLWQRTLILNRRDARGKGKLPQQIYGNRAGHPGGIVVVRVHYSKYQD